GTVAGDGDPLDVLVLMDEPAFVGCLVDVRLIGVIEGRQRETNGDRVRNDRLLAVAISSHLYANVRTPDDLSEDVLKGIEHFFVTYHLHDGTAFEVLARKGPAAAWQILSTSQRKKRRKR